MMLYTLNQLPSTLLFGSGSDDPSGSWGGRKRPTKKKKKAAAKPKK